MCDAVDKCSANMFKANVSMFRRLGRWLASNTTRLVLFFVIAVIVIAVCVSGVTKFELETRIDKLYIQENSRLKPEYETFQKHWGGLLRSEQVALVSRNESDPDMISRAKYAEFIELVKPIMKKDESAECAKFDGVVTTSPAACSDPNFPSLYCQCANEASSPNAITMDVPAKDSSGADTTFSVHMTDMCDGPGVPKFFAKADFESISASDTRAVTSPVYIGASTQTQAALEAANSLEGLAVYQTNKAAVKAAAENEIQTRTANGDSFITAVDATTPIIAGQWFGFVGDATTAGSLASVTMATVVTGFLGTEFRWVSQQNFFAYGYQEVAQCVLETYLADKANIISSVQSTTLAALTAGATNTVDPTALAAVRSVIQANAATKDIPTDTTLQAQLGFNYVVAAEEPYTSTVNAMCTGACQNAGALGAAKGQAITLIAAGADISELSNLGMIATAYVSNGGPAGEASNAAGAVATGLGANSAAAAELLPHIITAELTSLALGKLEAHSIGGQLRALPKVWGVDRFPCTRAVPMEMFREGGFDYPYQLKLAEQVSQAVFLWYNSAFSAHDTNNCIETAFASPLRDGIYLGSLTFTDGQAFPNTYQDAWQQAFRDGETAFLAAKAGGADDTTAAGSAFTAYVTSGGMVPVDNRGSSYVSPATLPAADQAAWGGILGTAIATAAGNSAALSDRLQNLVVPAIFSWGYHWRQPYGDDWTAKSEMTDDEMATFIDSGMRDTADPLVTVTECLAHKAADGRTVPACNLAWSGTKAPHELAFGGLLKENDILVGAEAVRLAVNNFNENDPSWSAAISAKLGRTVDSDERRDMHLNFESLLIDYLDARRLQQPGTSFEAGGANDDKLVIFGAARSTDDVVEEAAELETELLIGGYVVLLVYSMFSLSACFKTSVHSHMILAGWGVVTIATATFCAFGLASWFGLRFTPVNVAVVPFLSLGIGVDDMFVMAQTYANLARHHGDVKGIVGHTLAETGPSITFTSMTNLVAFLIASVTPIQVVQLFCLQMAIAVFLNWFLIFMMFVPALVLDARRTSYKKGEFGCVCCTDADRAPDDDGLLASLAEKYGRIILSRAGKIIILILFATFFGLMVWQGVDKHTQGVRISDIATDGSYQKDLAVLVEEKFQIFNAFIVTVGDELDNQASQQSQLDILDAMETNKWVVDSLKPGDLNYLDRFLTSQTGRTTIPTSAFYPSYGPYVSAVGGTDISWLTCADVNSASSANCELLQDNSATSVETKITASRTTLYLTSQSTHDNIVEAIRSTRATIDPISDAFRATGVDPNYKTYIFGYTYLYYEQYLNIENDLYFIVGIALVGVFVATFLFQFSARTSLILCLVILMVDFELFGFMRFINVSLNAFSLTNLCVAIGMAVEFTAHLAFEFLITPGESRKLRVISGLRHIMPPMTHGFITSILATSFIGGSSVAFLREYYFGMFLAMIIIAYLNGMVLLPVILTLFGPPPMEADLDEEDEISKQKMDQYENGLNPIFEMSRQEGLSRKASSCV